MPIQVVCKGCHARFQVSEKFAGKKGPCPKCKIEITIPKPSEEVKIHAPESFGPKDAKGRPTLKPLRRVDAKFNPMVALGIGAGVICVFFIALVLRGSIEDKTQFPLWILAAGAIVLAPPLVYGGYAVLVGGGDDLAPHTGTSLWIRVAICSAVYALIWGLVFVVNSYVFDSEGFSLPVLAVIVPLMMAAGAGAAFASLDLEFLNGLFHYGFYLVVTILLRVVAAGSPFPLEQLQQ